MLLLVTDTSGKDGFVALARAGGTGADKIEVIEEVPLAGGTFSAQLVPQISGLLGKHGFRKSDIGAFIVVSGPGSFTGLRVGLAAIKGLAEILQKPIAAVSLLDVMARDANVMAAGGSEPPGLFRYAVALDAGRGEAYVGQYESIVTEKTSASINSVQESLLAIEALAELGRSGAAHWISTPDPSIADFLTSAGSNVLRVERPRSQRIGSLGWKKLETGETVSPEQLDANYIRRSDAEIFAKLNR
jgi:tRNA threonylcarbamoyladenosine biosynthesis protein TsaB